MNLEPYQHSMKERRLTSAFNLGLQTAVYVLEKAEALSPEGRRYMIKELKKQIAEIEVKPPDPVLRLIK